MPRFEFKTSPIKELISNYKDVVNCSNEIRLLSESYNFSGGWLDGYWHHSIIGTADETNINEPGGIKDVFNKYKIPFTYTVLI